MEKEINTYFLLAVWDLPVYIHLINIMLDQNMSCFNSKGTFHEKNIWTCKKFKDYNHLKAFFLIME